MATNTAATRARKAEATGKFEDVTFTHGGNEYTVRGESLNNLELFEAIEDEKYLTATRGFLGREQWDAFKDSVRTDDGRVPMEPLEDFLADLMKAVGQGN